MTGSAIGTDVCRHFGVCGGCSKQDLGYDEQLKTKEVAVRTALQDLAVPAFHPILPSPDVFFYRNKMEFSFGDERDLEILTRTGPHPKSLSPWGRGTKGEGTYLGLHPKGRFALVTPTPDCRLLSDESGKICALVADWANEHRISIYVRKSGRGDLRHLVIREGKGTGQRMVNLIAKSTTPHLPELAERVRASNISITTFFWTPYDGLSDVARGGDQQIFWGDGHIVEQLGGLRFQIKPDSFMQTNTKAAEGMVDLLKAWVTRGETLIDLYCGSGAIGLSLADRFKEVIGIEINRSAVADAEANKQLNNIENAHFIEGKAEEVAPGLPVGGNAGGATVVVDPPRAGLHPKVLQTLLDWNIPSLFYVSCNPESLARDLRGLSARYDILDVQPMDFFPHTDHVETAVRLQRRTS